MKLVKESLYEKFTKEGDPISDMGIGTIAQLEKAIDKYYSGVYGRIRPEGKDTSRIDDIITKADGDEEKELKLATTMAKLIKDPEKMIRRYKAALEKHRPEIANIFLVKWGDLVDINSTFYPNYSSWKTPRIRRTPFR